MRSKDDLTQIVTALTSAECDRIFDLSFVDNTGVTPTKRKRIQAMLVSNDKRARPGWLDFLLSASEAFGSVKGDYLQWTADDLDFSDIIGEDFAASSSEILDDYIQYLHDHTDRFSKFPFALLLDLDRVEEGGKTVFSLPAGLV